GELEISDEVYYGVQTFRAVENFNISHERLKDFPRFVRALARVALVVAKKEAEVLAQKIKEETQNELALLQKHFEEQKDYEFRKM
ncbi:hypothetical protein VWO27_09970, partial [Campylobacter coli]|nr:hypothetical protein [Campylobacter coli]